MRTALTVALLLLATPAMAWNFCDRKYVPPVGFDHEPDAIVQVILLPADWLDGSCVVRGYPTLGGCAEEITPGKWWIRVRDDFTDAELACVLRHEKGHINGWVHGPSWRPDQSRDSFQRIMDAYQQTEKPVRHPAPATSIY